MRVVPIIAVLLVAAGSAKADEDPQVTMLPADPDRLAEYLHIFSDAGKIELAKPPRRIGMEVEFYKDGRLTAPSTINLAFRVKPQSKVFRFTVHVIDLDHAKLPEGKAAHARWRLRLAESNRSDAVKVKDVPKTDYDWSGKICYGTFGPRILDAHRVPVIWMVDAGAKGCRAGATPEAIIKNNQASGVAIVYVNWD